MSSLKYSIIILSAFLFTNFSGLFGLGKTALADGQNMADHPTLSKLERAQKRGVMRRHCNSLSKQLSKQFMVSANDNSLHKTGTMSPVSGNTPLPFETIYQKCLLLSDDEKGYSPDITVLSDALQPQEQMTALTIHTHPKRASIKILNILPAYQTRMALPVGLYHIVIEKKGFQKWDKWLKISGNTYIYHARLVQEEQVMTRPKIVTLSQTQRDIAAAQTAKLKEKAEALALIQYWAKRVVAQKRAQKAAILAAKQAKKREQAMATENRKQEKWVAEMEHTHKDTYRKTLNAGKRERKERIARMKAMTVKISLSGH